MNIDSIQNGVVLDHIQAGKSMDIYKYLHLDELDCSVAIIKNVRSDRMGKKDIIKIDSPMEVDLDVLGYIDPNITVNVIRNGQRVAKKHLELPQKLVNIIHCKKPPLHHRGGAPAGRHLSAQRPRQAHLSLCLLRHGKSSASCKIFLASCPTDCRRSDERRQFFAPGGVRQKRHRALAGVMTDAGFPLHDAPISPVFPLKAGTFPGIFCMQ